MALQISGGVGAKKATKPYTASQAQAQLGVTPAKKAPAAIAKVPGTNSVLKTPGMMQSGGGAPAPGGGGGGYPGGGGGGVGGQFATPMIQNQLSEEDYLGQDATYTAALAALDRALADYNTQFGVDTENYDRDYNKGLDSLGWRDPQDDIEGNFGWDQNDVLTSSGRAYQNQSNDFAARGMLQSQGYADALQNLFRSLGDQKGALDTARTDFQGDMTRKKGEFGNQDTLARQQARAEAAQRRAAEYGIA